MKVLLIQPPIEDFYTTPIRLYPLGLLYTAAVLRRLGADVELLDALTPLRKRQIPIPPHMSSLKPYFSSNPLLFKSYYRFGLPDDEIVARVLSASPDLIGISAQYTAYFSTAARLAERLAKETGVSIILGGAHATVFSREIKQRLPFVQVLTGPAESSLPPYWAQKRGGLPHTIDWKSLQPAHDLAAEGYAVGRKPYISLIAARGCPFGCKFCSVHTVFGRTVDYRPVDHVITEMRQSVELKGTRLFNFEDDNLSFDRRWFAEFLERVADEPMLHGVELTAMNGICWTTLDGELLGLMRAAGFRQLNLSLVTRDAELRRGLHRPVERRDFGLLVEEAKRLGFFVTVYFILGLPGQTYEEARRTIDYLLGHGVLAGPSVYYLAPGSELYEKSEVAEEVKSEWDLYRSSAFAVETPQMSRTQLIELFTYARAENLKRKR